MGPGSIERLDAARKYYREHEAPKDFGRHEMLRFWDVIRIRCHASRDWLVGPLLLRVTLIVGFVLKNLSQPALKMDLACGALGCINISSGAA